MTGQEPEGYKGVELSEGKIKGPRRVVNAPEMLEIVDSPATVAKNDSSCTHR